MIKKGWWSRRVEGVVRLARVCLSLVALLAEVLSLRALVWTTVE